MADYLSTTQIVTYVKRRITPTVLYSTIGVLLTALVVSVTWLQGDIRQFKDAVAANEKSMLETKANFAMLQDIKTELAVMNSKLDMLKDEQGRQRKLWDDVHAVANSPTYARRRR